MFLKRVGTGICFCSQRRIIRTGLDVSDIPRFQQFQVSFAEAVGPTVLDFGLLIFSILIVFAGAVTAFLRFDVR